MKTTHRRTKAVYSKLSIARESATIICDLAETQRQANEWESFMVGKGEGVRDALIAGCSYGRTAGGLARSGHRM